MTVGKPSRNRQARKNRAAALAAAFPQGIRCQKCLQYGHWSYQCTGKRKITMRPSRTQILHKNMQKLENGAKSSDEKCKKRVCSAPKKANKAKCTKKGAKSGSSSSNEPGSTSSSNNSSSEDSTDSESDRSSSSSSSSSESDSD